MELTLVEVIASDKALEALSKKHFKNFSVALKIAKLKKTLSENSDFYMKQERDIIDRYAEKQEDGNLKLVNGNLSFKTQDDIKGFTDDLSKLKETKIDIGEPIKIVVDKDLAPDQESLTPDEILALVNVIDFTMSE